MALRPNLFTSLGSEFKQQSRQVNSYYMLQPLLLFFCPTILHELCIKSLFFFWLPCTTFLLTHVYHTTFVVFMTQFFEWIFRSCLLEIHLSLCPLLWWSLGNESAVLENCTTEHRHRQGEGKCVIALNYLNKTLFQHIIHAAFRLLFMAHSCQSKGFKHTTQTLSVTCMHNVLCCKGKRAKVQGFKVHKRLTCFL